MAFLSASTSVFAQDDVKNHALLPEGIVRKLAIESPLPIYPEEAVRQNISGVVRIRIEISAEGEVLRIKVGSLGALK